MKIPSLATLALLTFFSLFGQAETLEFNFNDGNGMVDVNDFGSLVTAGAFTPNSVAHAEGFADMSFPASPRNTKKAFADISKNATDTMSVTLTLGPAATLNLSNIAFEFGFDEGLSTNALNPGYTLKYKIDAGAFVVIDTLSIDQGVGDVTGSTSTSVLAAPPVTYTLTATNTYGSTTATVKLYNGTAPNIVFVLADDMGWTDLNGFNEHSSTWYQTPRLATLAGESVRFNNCYAEPVCSPTRADLMTGFYPTRHHMYTVTNPNDNDKQLGRRENFSKDLPLNFTTVAEALTDLGYRCAHLGKWHLGAPHQTAIPFDPSAPAFDPATYPRDPRTRGFAYNVGGSKAGMPVGGSSTDSGPVTDVTEYTGGKYWADWQGKFRYLGPLPANGIPGQYLTDRLTEDAITIMETEKSKPFFIYLAHYGIHAPVQSPIADRLTGASPDPNHPGHSNVAFAGMIHALDRSVADVLTYLEDSDDPRNPGHKLIDNTMFIFMTDNGGYTSRSDNLPLKKGKASPYIRHIATNTSEDTRIQWDVLPGRLYSVSWSPDLNNNFTVLQSGIEYPVNSYTDTAHSGDARGFYIVAAQLK
jgi:hypothetical protein